MILALDIAAVLIAPLLDRAAARWPAGEWWLQEGARVVVLGVVLLHVLPAGWAEIGPLALVTAVAGFASATLIESRREPGANRASLAATAVALAVHHLLDGIALGQDDHHHLGLAVVAHTLPVALLSWRMASRRLGPAAGWGLLVALATSTLVGYGLGLHTLPGAGTGTAALATFLGGWLVHVFGHRHGAVPVDDVVQAVAPDAVDLRA